jgi:hypothetical protein
MYCSPFDKGASVEAERVEDATWRSSSASSRELTIARMAPIRSRFQESICGIQRPPSLSLSLSPFSFDLLHSHLFQTDVTISYLQLSRLLSTSTTRREIESKTKHRLTAAMVSHKHTLFQNVMGIDIFSGCVVRLSFTRRALRGHLPTYLKILLDRLSVSTSVFRPIFQLWRHFMQSVGFFFPFLTTLGSSYLVRYRTAR